MLDFSRREQDIKLLSLPSLGGTRIIKMSRNLDGSGQDQDELQRGRTTLFVVRKVVEEEWREIIIEYKV